MRMKVLKMKIGTKKKTLRRKNGRKSSVKMNVFVFFLSLKDVVFVV
jgi:hypothetical protein